jgi:23S rRNA pseudouridine2605 synthase
VIPVGSSKKAARRIGLARALSKLGYCSRSQAAQLIREGYVRLNEGVRFDPETPVHLTRDRILIHDCPIEASEKIYLMMNKPRGLITTAADEKGRETVYSLLKKSGFAAKGADSSKGASLQVNAWVAPVGRLDKASEGLLLLTNDSEWGARVAAPETHLQKTYHVQIARGADEELIAALTAGVNVAGNSGAGSGEKSDEKFAKGETLRAREARLLRSGQKNCWLEITLTEGKNRQIRRMLAALGSDVLRLVRVAIGPLHLGKLAKGGYRPLTADEKKMLDRAMQARTS